MPKTMFVVQKVVSNFGIGEEYKVSDSITLYPGGDYKVEFKNGYTMRCFFYYVEKISEPEKSEPFGGTTIYDNLKEFISLWGLIFDDRMPAVGLDKGIETPKVVEQIQQCDLNPVGYRTEKLLIDPASPKLSFLREERLDRSLSKAFQDFMEIDGEIRNRIRFFIGSNLRHQTNNSTHHFFDGYLHNITLDMFVLDSFINNDTCTSKFSCLVCKKPEVQHNATSYQDKVKVLFASFGDELAEPLARLVKKVKCKRNKFAHDALNEPRPPIQLPTEVEEDGSRKRSISGIDEIIDGFGREGLATMAAEDTLRDTVRMLLINQIFDTSFKPEVCLLKTFTSKTS